MWAGQQNPASSIFSTRQRLGVLDKIGAQIVGGSLTAVTLLETIEKNVDGLVSIRIVGFDLRVSAQCIPASAVLVDPDKRIGDGPGFVIPPGGIQVEPAELSERPGVAGVEIDGIGKQAFSLRRIPELQQGDR